MFSKFSKEELVEDLMNVYCRLGPSHIQGVGVFAIRDIPKGCNPFMGLRTTQDGWVEVPEEEVFKSEEIPESVKKMVGDLYLRRGGIVFFPQLGLNEIGMGYFVNHSDHPNLREENLEFFAVRDIKCGEELTVDYRTYDDTWV